MDNIEIFDRYLSDDMSETEKTEFDNRLGADAEFAEDFRYYKIVVKGIYEEGKEKSNELCQAFMHISEHELEDIVGPRKKIHKVRTTHKVFIGWLMSVAAVIVVAFFVNLNYKKSANEDIDNILFEYYYTPITRSGSIDQNLTSATEQIINILPKLRKEYESATDEQDISMYGINLAMVYLKLHNREMAKIIIEEVMNKCEDKDIKTQCEKLLNIIK